MGGESLAPPPGRRSGVGGAVIDFWRSFFLLTGCLLPACTGSGDPPLLRLALQTEPATLDPVAAVDFSSGTLSSLIHSNLVRFDAAGRIVPDLAREWSISEDGRRYRFSLFPARFANGRRVTARDVVFSFRRLLDPATVSPRWWVLEPVKSAASFHAGSPFSDDSMLALDDSTLVITLEGPTAHFLSLLSMPAAGVVCAEEVRERGADYGRRPCGSGPWKLSFWHAGEEIRLEKNSHCREINASVEGISFRILPESMTRIAEFEVGNLDILEVPGAEINHWRTAAPGLLQAEELRVVYIGLNNRKPPLDDPRVRRALNLAVDVETIIARILFGAGRRSRGPVPPALLPWPTGTDLYPYDPEEARRLLSEAGFPHGFSMEIWQRENPEAGRILESVQGYLARVGIEVKIVTREWGAFKQAVDRGTPDAFYLDWFADYPDAENFLQPLFHSSNRGGGGNRSGYANSRVDSLLEEAAAQVNAGTRTRLYQRAEELIYRDAPWIFLWFPIRYEVVSERITGYRIPLIFNGRRFLEVSFSGRSDH